jgi:hypothetical protein
MTKNSGLSTLFGLGLGFLVLGLCYLPLRPKTQDQKPKTN